MTLCYTLKKEETKILTENKIQKLQRKFRKKKTKQQQQKRKNIFGKNFFEEN